MADPVNPLENERFGDQSSVGLYTGPGNRGVRVIRGVPWANVLQARLDLEGYAVMDGGSILRFLPSQNPDDISQYCVKAEVRPRQAIGQTDRGTPSAGLLQTGNEYESADIVATFETLPYKVGTLVDGTVDQTGVTPADETARYATMMMRGGVEQVNAKPGIYSWQYNPTLIVGPPSQFVPFVIPVQVPYGDIEIILYQWPVAAYPQTAITACLGRVNADTQPLPQCPIPWNDAEAETLVLLGAFPEPGFFPDGTRYVNIHYYMRSQELEDTTSDLGPGVSNIGWNVFPAPDGTFLRVSLVGNATLGAFQTADFSGLFLPEP